MKILCELAGAAIGAAVLWLSVPLFIIVLSAAGAIFEAYGLFIILCFPLCIALRIGQALHEIYKRTQGKK